MKHFTLKRLALMGAALVGVAVIAAGCQTADAAGNRTDAQPYPANTISVSGTGDAYGQPDQASVMLGVSVSDSDVSKAVTKSNESMTKITDAIKGLGIDAKDIQTTNFSVWPEQPTDQNGQPSGNTIFHVDSTVQIT